MRRQKYPPFADSLLFCAAIGAAVLLIKGLAWLSLKLWPQ